MFSLQRRQSSKNEKLVTTVKETQSAVRNYLDQVSMLDREWKQQVLASLNETYSEKKRAEDSAQLPAVNMKDNLETGDVESFSQRLLLQLQFREMDYRYDKISDAHAKTFEWIFRPPESPIWSNFVEWLTNNESLYWITGKPAAGKSTLLKFVYKDSRTQALLRKWAADKKLIVSSFYFWHAGATMQMSQEGFARTLLHSALQQAPDLIPAVFPNRLETYVLFGHKTAWAAPWTWKELVTAFRSLIKEAGKTMRLFFLVDGLDEFNGNHDELVELVQSFLDPNVKICVSSRPWNVFEDGFRQRPSLRVEDLTSQDIRHYVRARFLANPGFTQLHMLDPEFADRLIENVTQKSKGVFLWVSLVTDSLLEGLRDGERLTDLEQRLDSLPQDLESLFWAVLSNLNPQQKARTSQILQILRSSLDPMTLLMMSFADEEDPEHALKIPVATIPLQQATARAEIMRRRLNGCCKGLIEASRGCTSYLPDAEIGYLHRTVKDYFDRPEVWTEFVAMTGPKFYPDVRLCNAQLAMFKISPSPLVRDSAHRNRFLDKVATIIEYAVRAERAGAGLQLSLLKDLDSAATKRVKAEGYSDHWSTGWMACEYNRDFVHLAVQCQLWSYIESALSEPLDPQIQRNITNLLFVAAHQYSLFKPAPTSDKDPSFKRFKYVFMNNPHAEIIQLILERGADPNVKFHNALVDFGIAGSYSTWEVICMKTEQSNFDYTEIFGLFLKHGADPKVWLKIKGNRGGVSKLARRKRNEARLTRVASIFGMREHKR